MKSPARRRLAPNEVGIIKYLAKRQGAGMRFVLLGDQLRAAIIPIWRDGLIEIWYRQYPADAYGFSGPQFSLSLSGRRLAAAIFRASWPTEINPAPRGFSGAETNS